MSGIGDDAVTWVLLGFPLTILAYYWFARLVIGRHTTRRESRRQRAQRSVGPDFWNPWSAIPLPPDDDQLARMFVGADGR